MLASLPIRSHRTKLIDDAKSPNPRFRGLIHGTAVIVREEGLRGVYRGLFPVVSGLIPSGMSECRFLVLVRRAVDEKLLSKFLYFPAE